MPVTFPSHAAAILPLHHLSKGRLWLVPLISGSCAPDLAYALSGDGDFSHSGVGLFAFCLPAGLGLYLWLERLALPALRLSLPAFGGLRPGRFLSTRGLPRSLPEGLWALLALLLGAATHLLWDGFTHRTSEPAASLYGTVKVDLGFRQAHLSAVLQHVSSVMGAAIFAGWAWRRRRLLPELAPGSARKLRVLLAGAFAGGLIAFLIERQAILSGSLHWALWLGFWMTARGALVGFTAACLWVLSASRGQRLPGSPAP